MNVSARDQEVILVYLPVIHKGYLRLFQKYPKASILILDEVVLGGFPLLGRDLRANKPEVALKMLKPLFLCRDIELAHSTRLHMLSSSSTKIYLPDEDLMHEIAEEYQFPKERVFFERTFLRWDKMATLTKQEIPPDRTISTSQVDQELMSQAKLEAARSSDWWRQVGVVAVKEDGQILLVGHNSHQPTDYSLYISGDPRSNFDAGERIDLCGAIHAETQLIATAAREGICLSGASLYVTTFPCPSCAYSIMAAGFKKVYYSQGYSVLSAEKLFRQAGVEMILVQNTPQSL